MITKQRARRIMSEFVNGVFDTIDENEDLFDSAQDILELVAENVNETLDSPDVLEYLDNL